MTKKYTAVERRKEISDLMLNEGFFSINKSALGRKYGVSDVMIGKDIDIIFKKMADEKLEDTIKKLHVGYMRVLSTSEKLLLSEDENIKLKAVNSYNQVVNEYIKFLKHVAKVVEYSKYDRENFLNSS